MLDVHLCSPRTPPWSPPWPGGLLTLLLAALNYVNLATARAACAPEVALRKVMGATRAALMAQFMARRHWPSPVAALIGVALASWPCRWSTPPGGVSLALDYFGAPTASCRVAWRWPR